MIEKPPKFGSMAEMFTTLVPEYRGRSWSPFWVRFIWDPKIAQFMKSISKRRCQRRLDSYIIPGELERSTASMRFGNKKEGHGYQGKRGDFCLIGATLDKNHLTLFYRSLELIGGLHYDTAIINEIDKRAPVDIKHVTIMAASAFCFARRGNSNEKLYKQLTDHYGSV